MPIPDGLTRAHVLDALRQLDAGVSHDFGGSTKYDLIHGTRRYPPKAVIGLAAEALTGRRLDPSNFSGGEAPGQANYVRIGPTPTAVLGAVSFIVGSP